MYFFYCDESGSRDPSVGTADKPKDHLYVLTAVGMWEGYWKRFDREVSTAKLKLINTPRRELRGNFNLATCELKSNWVRNPKKSVKKKVHSSMRCMTMNLSH